MFAARTCQNNKALLRCGANRAAVSFLVRSKYSTQPKVEEKHFNNSQARRSLREMPGPSMFENLVLFARDGFRHHHIFVEEMFERYGRIFKHSLPGAEVVYVSDPEAIEHVYRVEESNIPFVGETSLTKYYKKNGWDRGISGDDDSWYVWRKPIVERILRLNALKPYFDEILNVADDTVSSMTNGRNFDIQESLAKWSLESVGVVLFGRRLEANSKTPSVLTQELIGSIDGLFEAETKLFLSIPFHKYFETPTLKEVYRHLDVEVNIARHFLEKTRIEPTEMKEMSLVHRLENDDKFPDRVIHQIIIQLFHAGIHTTVSNTLLLLNNLSTHPKVQEKARDEIQQIIGDNRPTYEHLSKMRYIKAIIKEGFRYNTSPIGNLRVTKCPTTLHGYHLPPGTRVVLAAMASKEMQKQKYGNPEKFAPERWFRDAEKRPHPFSSLPFSFGKRECAGRNLLELELSLLLIRLLQKYEIVENTVPEEQVEWIFNLLVTADRPFVMYLKQR